MTRVLVIEDEAPLREEVVDMLAFEDFDVIAAENGRIGVQLAHEQLPDLILCDITMPDLDGYGVLLELQKDRVTSTIPFIFLTARADKSFMRHGMELGADDYITKPFTRGELLAAIRTRLKRHSAVIEAHRRELEEAKVKLARMVAHELRTPLFNISSVHDLVERQLGALSPSGTRELLEIMGSGVERLNHLVEQMVYMTQIESGLLNYETVMQNGMPLRIVEVLHDAITLGRRFAHHHHDLNIRLDDRDGEAIVVAHAHALKHALAELIANALNFSKERGEVHVSQWQDEDGIWVSILDQGIGMTPKEQAQAMEKYVQVNRQTHEQQGMGLGLPLAHEIIRAHGGTLDMRSQPERGTEIIVGLPSASETAY
jgi:signal transduction histidine kinase